MYVHSESGVVWVGRRFVIVPDHSPVTASLFSLPTHSVTKALQAHGLGEASYCQELYNACRSFSVPASTPASSCNAGGLLSRLRCRHLRCFSVTTSSSTKCAFSVQYQHRRTF